jgi:hypothetical protein
MVFPNRSEILENIKTGRHTFLIDANGDFVGNSMELDTSGSQPRRIASAILVESATICNMMS